MSIGIGSTIWTYDPNRRKYTKPKKGQMYGSIIYKYHWKPNTIIGETKVSWIIDSWGTKIPKRMVSQPFSLRGTEGRTFAISEEEIDLDCWANSERPNIVRAVGYCDVKTLKKVAELIGYKPTQEPLPS